MNLPSLEKLNVKEKHVLLRLDLDVPLQEAAGKVEVADDTRLRASIPTIKYLVEQKARRIVILGHRGRPQGKVAESLSLKPVGEHLEKLLEGELGAKIKEANIFMMENLRFSAGEEANDEHFAEHLAHEGEAYVNDAFAASHREHASIVGLPRFLPHAAGIHIAEEVRVLSKVLESPKKPVVVVLGGGKFDKAFLVERLLDHAEWLLVGGVLPKRVKSYCREKDGHMCVSAAHLTRDGEDITPDSAKNFSQIIKDAGTIVWNGPMGDIDQGHWDGTDAVANAVATSSAYKVIGGGDTIHALQKLGLLGKMDYVSTGGGSMLEFLAYGDLPGLKALRN